MTDQPFRIAVAGGSKAGADVLELAFEVGHEIGRRDGILLCGGRMGVMERAAAGARRAGATTIGILPGASAVESPPNSSIEIPIFTGLGQARNLVLVLAAEAVIAIGGRWGTLSEIALAIKHGIPVVLLESWNRLLPEAEDEPLLAVAASAQDAVEHAAAAISRRRGSKG